MKQCSKCKEWKDEGEFCRNKNGADGLHSQCKICVKEYYIENREKIKIQRKGYRERNRFVKKAIKANNKFNEKISSRELKQIYENAKGFCHYCGKDITKGFTFDHKIPFVKGGKNIKENLVLCCLNCNRRKNSKDYDEFIKQLAEEGGSND